MEHKAFIIDYEQFERELRPLLQEALLTKNCDGLIDFIRQNIESLADPYEGEPLQGNWEDMIETPDAHQYGDFALTKYYKPSNDIGLGSSWGAIQDVVDADRGISPILGAVVGGSDNPFDPGKMGSYFQSSKQVRESLDHLQQLAREKPTDEIDDAIALLEHASQSGRGLYVTF